jgi:hypothetical protein
MLREAQKAHGRARDCSGNPFGVAKRLKRKARFFAVWGFWAQITKPPKIRPQYES